VESELPEQVEKSASDWLRAISTTGPFSILSNSGVVLRFNRHSDDVGEDADALLLLVEEKDCLESCGGDLS
jgi:hypothetical protein